MSKYKDKEIKYVETYDEESIVFQWGIEGIGFGEISFYYKDGTLKCDNEYMSKEFIKAILSDFVDRAELIDKKED